MVGWTKQTQSSGSACTADHVSPAAPATGPDFATGQRPARAWWASAHTRISQLSSLGTAAGLRTPRPAASNRASEPPPGSPLQPTSRDWSTTCHDSPNVGNHSVKAPLDIGLADPARASYLPVYKLVNLATHQSVHVTDPGRAMVTGKWADVGKFKGPILRALAARAPYFHNGSAATLDEVIDFYETRFHLGLSAQQKADLVAFLRCL